jgi:ABC-type dipeptide/oligopeptide/nickel transport system permease subunit
MSDPGANDAAAAMGEPAAVRAHRPARASRGFWADAWRRLLRNPVAVISMGFLICLATAATVAPMLLPHSYERQDLVALYSAPSTAHWLGTDHLGRDLLSRLMVGARISLAVGFVAEFIIISLGTIMGSLAGYFGGWVDSLIMRVVDALYAFPDLLLIIIVMSYVKAQLGGSVAGWLVPLAMLNRALGGLLGVFIALGLTSWLTTCRLVRGQILSLREREFVEAARVMGANPGRIIRAHLLPNTMGPILVAATLGVPYAILLEASLSFIGLGVDPPMPSWGLMISEGVQAVQSYPHVILAPALAISLTLLGFNFLGDGLRDALDPLLKRM